MPANPKQTNGATLFTSFEGYRDPTEAEAIDALESSLVVLDTNVLLDIYSFDEPARVRALEVLDWVSERVWVAHQVVREFWRNRQSVIAQIPVPTDPLTKVRGELFAIVNGLSPDGARTKQFDELRETIGRQLDELSNALQEARGDGLDVQKLLSNTSADPILERLGEVLSGRVGPRPDDEDALISEGLRRFADLVPPGYEDGRDKEDQRPERGTGDFLVWEQTLRHASSLHLSRPFVFVTDDSKEDWRVVVKQPRKKALGVRPELVAEAIQRTGQAVILLTQSDFYRLMSTSRHADDASSKSLIAATAERSTSESIAEFDSWSFEAYCALLDLLKSRGREEQIAAIELAARNGGFASRAAIYESAGFATDRTLVKFSLPAQRAALELIDRGLLGDGAAQPLLAVYDTPGKATGYEVPSEFIGHERRRESSASLTWLDAAAEVARSDKSRAWTVRELVAEIESRGLRDLSGAKTPENTLRRDLRERGWGLFEATSDGRYVLRADEEHPSQNEL